MKTASNMKTTSNIKIASNMKTTSNIKITSNMKTTSNIKITSNMRTTSNMKTNPTKFPKVGPELGTDQPQLVEDIFQNTYSPKKYDGHKQDKTEHGLTHED